MERDFKSPEYKSWRYKVFCRDQFTCQMCGKKDAKDIEAHHIIPWSKCEKTRFLHTNGITLCKSCHASVTGSEEDYEAKFKRIVQKKLEDQGLKGSKKLRVKRKYRPRDPRLRI